ncbi:MAG: hypothetical protein ABIZ04_20325 [Opitutus sp.]
MRSLLVLSLACLLTTPAVSFAAQSPDPELLNGLQAWNANGPIAGLRVWYASQPDLALELGDTLKAAVKTMGQVIDTEVIAIQPVSKRVTRYYVAVNYTNGPLWIRIERYVSDKQPIFLRLRFSTDPDRILPGYLTEFQL